MNKKRKIACVLVPLFLLVSPFSASIKGRMKAESFIGGEVYPSFKSRNYDYLPVFYPGGGDKMKGLGLLSVPVLIIDFPVSATIDTLLFPFDYVVYKVRYSNSKSEVADVTQEAAKSLEQDAYEIEVRYDYWYPLINHKGEVVSYKDEPGLNDVHRETVRHFERFYQESKNALVISKYENVSFLDLSSKHLDAGVLDASGVKDDAYEGGTLKGVAHQVRIDKVKVFEANGGVAYATLLINVSKKCIYVSLKFEEKKKMIAN